MFDIEKLLHIYLIDLNMLKIFFILIFVKNIIYLTLQFQNRYFYFSLSLNFAIEVDII